eukprot:scaffold26_cov397-Pavlova_lutheri.AAC.6
MYRRGQERHPRSWWKMATHDGRDGSKGNVLKATKKSDASGGNAWSENHGNNMIERMDHQVGNMAKSQGLRVI